LFLTLLFENPLAALVVFGGDPTRTAVAGVETLVYLGVGQRRENVDKRSE